MDEAVVTTSVWRVPLRLNRGQRLMMAEGNLLLLMLGVKRAHQPLLVDVMIHRMPG